MHEEYLDVLREAAMKKLLFLPHAVRQMNRPDRMIRPGEVRRVIIEGRIIEDYPEDARGHSCLIMGFGNQSRPLHVVCAPKDEYLAIITAYVPDEKQWGNRYSERIKK